MVLLCCLFVVYVVIILCIAREVFRVVCILMGHFNVRARVVRCDHDGGWIGVSTRRLTPESGLFVCFLGVFLFRRVVGENLFQRWFRIRHFSSCRQVWLESSDEVSFLFSL